MQTRAATPRAGAPLQPQLRAAPHAAARSLRRRPAAPLSRTQPRAAAAPPPPGEYSNETKMRSEAQAPFRVFRQFLFGAFGVSATIGSGVSFIQFTTGLAGAPSAPPVAQSGQNLAIDGAVLALMVFLWRRDEAARQRQMARISREETLAALRVQLSSQKTVRLAALRGFARVVVVAGSAAFVEEAAAAAEPHKEALLARGVLFVPLVTDGAQKPPPPLPASASASDKRWRGEPQFVTEWTRWLGDQMSAASVAAGAGVYVSLRMDGRVRASGVGQPPWALLAASLPPVEGFFGGFLDGMDGRVGSE
jgi:hypothetical protein